MTHRAAVRRGAPRSRRSFAWFITKDWYDIAFVLLHNDAGGSEAAAQAVRDRFGDQLVGTTRTALRDLLANFADVHAQGPRAYAQQMCLDHPDLDARTLAADAVVSVELFYRILFQL